MYNHTASNYFYYNLLVIFEINWEIVQGRLLKWTFKRDQKVLVLGDCKKLTNRRSNIIWNINILSLLCLHLGNRINCHVLSKMQSSDIYWLFHYQWSSYVVFIRRLPIAESHKLPTNVVWVQKKLREKTPTNII